MAIQSDISSRIHISTPSRLHFGLISACADGNSPGGGAGVMIECPKTVVVVETSGSFEIHGECQSRVSEIVERWLKWRNELEQTGFREYREIPCAVRLVSHVPQHVGLGSGSQLALAIATGLNRLFATPAHDAAALAQSIGRGARSRIGSFGFFHGGFVVEQVKTDGDTHMQRVSLPQSWRVLVVRLKDQVGLAGEAESGAFARIQPANSIQKAELQSIGVARMMPAARNGDFTGFSESVYDFGRKSGQLFASVQGGAYNGESIARLVDTVRKFGIKGVGQSSWGPSVYAWCPNQLEADNLRSFLEDGWNERAEFRVTQVCNHGATVTETPI